MTHHIYGLPWDRRITSRGRLQPQTGESNLQPSRMMLPRILLLAAWVDSGVAQSLWLDSTEGIHLMAEEGSNWTSTSNMRHFDFVWGQAADGSGWPWSRNGSSGAGSQGMGPARVALWHKYNPRAVVAEYIPCNRDPEAVRPLAWCASVRLVRPPARVTPSVHPLVRLPSHSVRAFARRLPESFPPRTPKITNAWDPLRVTGQPSCPSRFVRGRSATSSGHTQHVGPQLPGKPGAAFFFLSHGYIGACRASYVVKKASFFFARKVGVAPPGLDPLPVERRSPPPFFHAVVSEHAVGARPRARPLRPGGIQPAAVSSNAFPRRCHAIRR